MGRKRRLSKGLVDVLCRSRVLLCVRCERVGNGDCEDMEGRRGWESGEPGGSGR